MLSAETLTCAYDNKPGKPVKQAFCSLLTSYSTQAVVANRHTHP